MKKLIAVIMAAAVALGMTSAQLAARGGIEAGYVNSSYNFKKGISKDNNYLLNGFYVGLSKDVRLFAGLHIVPGIYYTYLTDNSKDEVLGLKLRGNASDHYLSVPIMFRYQFGLPGVKLYVFAGPTLSAGLVAKQKYIVSGDILGSNINGEVSYNLYTGKIKTDDIDISQDGENPVEGITPDYMYNRFDVQLGGGVGIEVLKFLEVKVGYDFGLMNRYKGDAAELYRNQFYAAVGFRF